MSSAPMEEASTSWADCSHALLTSSMGVVSNRSSVLRQIAAAFTACSPMFGYSSTIAMHSISTDACLGSSATATVERAGAGLPK